MLTKQVPTGYLVRHGSTDWNSDEGGGEKFRGTSSIDLNSEGVQEAKDAAQLLKSTGVTVVYSDNIVRTKHTGQIIADALGAQHIVDEKMRQWELGELTGKPVEANLSMIKSYSEQTPDKPLPGGESFNQWRESYLTALDKILATAVKDNQPFAIIVHTIDSQLIRGSEETEGGLSNHNINVQVFEDYDTAQETGSIVKMTSVGGRQWKMEDFAGGKSQGKEPA